MSNFTRGKIIRQQTLINDNKRLLNFCCRIIKNKRLKMNYSKVNEKICNFGGVK